MKELRDYVHHVENVWINEKWRKDNNGDKWLKLDERVRKFETDEFTLTHAILFITQLQVSPSLTYSSISKQLATFRIHPTQEAVDPTTASAFCDFLFSEDWSVNTWVADDGL